MNRDVRIAFATIVVLTIVFNLGNFVSHQEQQVVPVYHSSAYIPVTANTASAVLGDLSVPADMSEDVDEYSDFYFEDEYDFESY